MSKGIFFTGSCRSGVVNPAMLIAGIRKYRFSVTVTIIQMDQELLKWSETER